jgi:RHS repeat-associated protein
VYGLGLLYQEQAAVYQQHHFDSRGSTVAMTGSTGLVTDRFQYGPYGEPLGHTGSTDTPFQSNGRYGVQTDLNGLLYMRARYYDPTIRRFINQDPTLGSIALGITLNRFAFANGNPVSFMDPFGLCAQQNDPLQTRIANLAGGFINGITNAVLTAAQWVSIIGGEPEAADFAQENMDVVARLGLYNSNSPIAQGGASVANNLVIDSFLFGGAEFVGTGTAESAAPVYEDLVQAAQEAYPGKAGVTELHHVTPKYLGGAADGPTVALDAAYHQQITNEFRSLWPYGDAQPNPQQLHEILQKVYNKYPLPPGG